MTERRGLGPQEEEESIVGEFFLAFIVSVLGKVKTQRLKTQIKMSDELRSMMNPFGTRQQQGLVPPSRRKEQAPWEVSAGVELRGAGVTRVTDPTHPGAWRATTTQGHQPLHSQFSLILNIATLFYKWKVGAQTKSFSSCGPNDLP